MKNYSNKKSRTLSKEAGENTPFIKIKDLFGDRKTFEKGEVTIHGFIKVRSKLYDKDQYSLLVTYKGVDYFLNVPTWYGAAVEEDFGNSGQTAEDFFEGASIKKIEEFETKFKNNTVNIVIYE